MQKMYLADAKKMPEITLNAGAFAGDFCVVDTAAEVNISCVVEIRAEKSIGLQGKTDPGKVFTVRESGKVLYRVVESLVAGFTAVVYGFFCRVCRKMVRIAEKFRREKMVPVRCRMAKLAFAGGLRL
ncbi:MAG: hypothetical protein J6W00_12360 [Lentisphaeria bacterium]|nr:hypothetical protein [Lentisphaeria bacterium]